MNLNFYLLFAFCISLCFAGKSEARVPIIPLKCDSTAASELQPYLDELDKKLPADKLMKLRSLPKERIEYGMGDSSGISISISSLWLSRKYLNHELIDVYKRHGIKSGEDIIQDLKEGLWVSNHADRCALIRRPMPSDDPQRIKVYPATVKPKESNRNLEK